MARPLNRRFTQSESRQRYGEGNGTSTGGGGGVTIEASGSAIVAEATAVNFGTNLEAVDDGDGTVTANLKTDGRIIESATNETFAFSDTDPSYASGVVIGQEAEIAGERQTIIGWRANKGGGSVGRDVIIGDAAGSGASEFSVTFLGSAAGIDNSAEDVFAVGENAARNNAGDRFVAIGVNAGWDNQGNDSVALGDRAMTVNALSNQGNPFGCTAIGSRAGQNATAQECVYIGLFAGRGNDQPGVIALGRDAGAPNEGNPVPANTFTVTDSDGNEGLRYDLVEHALTGPSFLELLNRSSDPSTPSAGRSRIWQSDGTGSGDDGDLMVSITDSNGLTKTTTLVDFSAI